jgi:hypothetical protein
MNSRAMARIMRVKSQRATGDEDVRDHAARRVQILTLRVPIRHSALVECFASFRHRQTYFPSCEPVWSDR